MSLQSIQSLLGRAERTGAYETEMLCRQAIAGDLFAEQKCNRLLDRERKAQPKRDEGETLHHSLFRLRGLVRVWFWRDVEEKIKLGKVAQINDCGVDLMFDPNGKVSTHDSRGHVRWMPVAKESALKTDHERVVREYFSIDLDMPMPNGAKP